MAGDVWQVKIEGKVYEADTDTLVEWAAGGYVQPGDKVKKGALDWTEAKNVPVLRGPLQQFQMNPPQPPQGYANPGFQNQGYASPGYGNPGGYQSGQGWYAGEPEKPKTGLAAFMARFETPIFNGYVLWLTAVCVVTLVLAPLVWAIGGGIPAALLCLGVGAVVSIIGGLVFLVTAFNVNLLWGLGCFFVPGVSLIFLILNWDVAKRPFILSLIGTALMLAGYVPLLSSLPRPEESRFIHRNGIISVARPGTEPATVLSLPVRLS